MRHITFFCLLLCAATTRFFPQTQEPARQALPNPALEEETPPPGDWAPELLFSILSSPNSEASDDLHRAAFACGRDLVPRLEAALKDDRTAEFAAQSLAFIGGEKALEMLSKLVDDPRDLDLRRFFYGALGEVRTPEATRVLLDAVANANREPDRTVTEAAILALTVRSDPNLVRSLRALQAKTQDVVIRDDLDNAAEVIERRVRYLASPEGKKPGVSLDRAIRTYFIPALEPQPATPAPPNAPSKSSAQSKSPPAKPAQPKPAINVEIQSLAFFPDKTRALARVIFEDPTARAYYDMVLQKQFGDWTLASVWLGKEEEKPGAIRKEE